MAVPSGAAIASDALKYAGQRYTYGGRADVPGDWDCSSFVSYVLGHDLGMTLPGGGRYGDPGNPPNAHGPVVLSYAGWSGATTLPKGSSPAAGDLCIWPGAGAVGHIGIAVDGTHMVSALDHTDGTVHTPIQGYGPAGVPVVFRRINGAGQLPAGSAAGAGSGGAAAAVLLGALAGGAVPLVFAGVIIGAAGLVGAIIAAVLAAGIRKAGQQ